MVDHKTSIFGLHGAAGDPNKRVGAHGAASIAALDGVVAEASQVSGRSRPYATPICRSVP